MSYQDDMLSGANAPAESPLAPAILRGLGDRSYDKRKNAALEVETLIKATHASGDTDRICSIIALLGQDFATSTNANHRKGGLIGLAATAIGLMGHARLYLDALLPPVLHCLDDPESRVRYYACESMYNVAKVARGDILLYFNQIFDGLCKLFSDVDVDVKNGSNLLDRLIKDIVTESESFDVERFIPLLQKYIRRTNPYIRQLLVGWITVLDSVPGINMIDWLPDFLDGLFNMLSDGNREIRQAADSVLAEFLREMKGSSFVEYGPMVNIVAGQCNSKERFSRLTAITWVHEFINLGGDRLLLFYSELLSAVMHCISDSDTEIRAMAQQTNVELLELVTSTAKDFLLSPLLKTLTIELLSHHVSTRMAALRWLNMLLEKLPSDMGAFMEELLPPLLKTLSDDADEVVLMNLQVLARISLDETEFQRVLNAILQLFASDPRLLETRGSLIVRRLCVLLQGRRIFITLANVLRAKSDLHFIFIMVQALNLILLTASELEELRDALRRSFTDSATAEDRAVFNTLFPCWCHNPVSTFSLCLLAQAYDLSSELIQEFGAVEVTVAFLMQVDKLVQLLESPIFLRLRLQLLDVGAPCYPALIKSLYGLLMLLPQSSAFSTLHTRLDTACSLRQNLASSSAPAPLPTLTAAAAAAVAEASTSTGKKASSSSSSSSSLPAPSSPSSAAHASAARRKELLSSFKSAQERHMGMRRERVNRKSLQAAPADSSSGEK